MKKETKTFLMRVAPLAVMVVMSAITGGCGGGGGSNQIPGVPHTLQRDCTREPVSFRTLDRSSASYVSESGNNVQCIQIVYSQTTDIGDGTTTIDSSAVYPTSISVSASSTLYVFALLFDYSCNRVIPNGDFSWNVSGYAAEINNVVRYEESTSSTYGLEIAQLTIFPEGGATGTITVSYENHSDVVPLTVTSTYGAISKSF